MLKTWSFRLDMNRRGVTSQWTPLLRQTVENLIEKLKALEPAEIIDIDGDLEHSVKIVRSKTGEILCQFEMLPNAVAEGLSKS